MTWEELEQILKSKNIEIRYGIWPGDKYSIVPSPRCYALVSTEIGDLPEATGLTWKELNEAGFSATYAEEYVFRVLDSYCDKNTSE